MAFDSVPWFIGAEGAQHSPAVARMLAYAATNGATGVISPGDLKVTALPTPGAFVRIMPGGAAMLNRYPGAPNQSYTARNPTASDFDVTATGSSGGATKYLILRVDDPEFGGAAPANPATGPYVRPVWVNSIDNLQYPFVKLSKLVQPANTATITNAMLTDIRELANPRTLREIVSSSGGVAALTSTTGQVWPPYSPTIVIPEWATYVHVIVHLSGFLQDKSLAEGQLAVRMGDTALGGALRLDYDGVTDGVRHTTMVTGAQPLAASVRGTPQQFRLWAARLNTSTRPGVFRSDASTHMAVDVQFSEKVV